MKISFDLANSATQMSPSQTDSADSDEMLHYAAFHLVFTVCLGRTLLGVSSIQIIEREHSDSVVECLTEELRVCASLASLLCFLEQDALCP